MPIDYEGGELGADTIVLQSLFSFDICQRDDVGHLLGCLHGLTLLTKRELRPVPKICLTMNNYINLFFYCVPNKTSFHRRRRRRPGQKSFDIIIEIFCGRDCLEIKIKNQRFGRSSTSLTSLVKKQAYINKMTVLTSPVLKRSNKKNIEVLNV